MWAGGVVNKEQKNEGGGVAVRSCNQPSPARLASGRKPFFSPAS